MNPVSNSTMLNPLGTKGISDSQTKVYELFFLAIILGMLLIMGIMFALLNMGAGFLNQTSDKDTEESPYVRVSANV